MRSGAVQEEYMVTTEEVCLRRGKEDLHASNYWREHRSSSLLLLLLDTVVVGAGNAAVWAEWGRRSTSAGWLLSCLFGRVAFAVNHGGANDCCFAPWLSAVHGLTHLHRSLLHLRCIRVPLSIFDHNDWTIHQIIFCMIDCHDNWISLTWSEFVCTKMFQLWVIKRTLDVQSDDLTYKNIKTV